MLHGELVERTCSRSVTSAARCPDAEGGMVLPKLRQLLNFELSIAELIGVGLLVGTPYLIVGVAWASIHTESLQQLDHADLLVSIVGSIVLWPVLLTTHFCPT
jgi:ABC-type transport system involved in cytochrome c biogenesis permease component